VANFLVAGEEEADGAVRELRVLDQRVGQLHDDRDARLVVGSEERCAVGGDERFADEVR
jgi:hypothetical protein